MNHTTYLPEKINHRFTAGDKIVMPDDGGVPRTIMGIERNALGVVCYSMSNGFVSRATVDKHARIWEPEPNLGSATNQQLIDELQCRWSSPGAQRPGYRTIDSS